MRLARSGLVLPCLLTWGLAIGAGVQTANAQSSSPEIKADERADPAAGEVVIINPGRLKKRRGRKSPDPYSPIKLKPLPKKTSANKQAAKTKPGKTAPAREPKRKMVVAKPAPSSANVVREVKPPLPVRAARAAQTDNAAPPLPRLNDQPRPRLRQFPPASLTDGRTSGRHAALGDETPPEAEHRDTEQRQRNTRRRARALRAAALQRQAERRAARAAERRRRERRYRRQRAALERQYYRRYRPWRMCRRLAWGCRDGYEEACYLWHRRC